MEFAAKLAGRFPASAAVNLSASEQGRTMHSLFLLPPTLMILLMSSSALNVKKSSPLAGLQP